MCFFVGRQLLLTTSIRDDSIIDGNALRNGSRFGSVTATENSAVNDAIVDRRFLSDWLDRSWNWFATMNAVGFATLQAMSNIWVNNSFDCSFVFFFILKCVHFVESSSRKKEVQQLAHASERILLSKSKIINNEIKTKNTFWVFQTNLFCLFFRNANYI